MRSGLCWNGKGREIRWILTSFFFFFLFIRSSYYLLKREVLANACSIKDIGIQKKAYLFFQFLSGIFERIFPVCIFVLLYYVSSASVPFSPFD